MIEFRRIATFTCIGFFAAASAAFAGVRIDASGGAAPANSAFAIERAEGIDQDRGVATAGSYAVGASWVFDDRIELGGQWQQSFFDDWTYFSEVDQDATLSSATVGGRYQFFDREYLFRPYLAGQVGLAFADATSEFDELFGPEVTRVSAEETGFGMNAGGGIDFQITRLFSVGADVRYNYAGVLGDAHYLTTLVNLGLHFG
jgi:opacity protein-like surface antigen